MGKIPLTPPLLKGKSFSSLGKREVGRDLTNYSFIKGQHE
jgi:hypothetical protein